MERAGPFARALKNASGRSRWRGMTSAGGRDGQRHPWQRRVPRPPHRRAGAARSGGAGGLTLSACTAAMVARSARAAAQAHVEHRLLAACPQPVEADVRVREAWSWFDPSRTRVTSSCCNAQPYTRRLLRGYTYPTFPTLMVGVGRAHEATRSDCPTWRHGRYMAARCACTAAGDAGDWIPRQRIA